MRFSLSIVMDVHGRNKQDLYKTNTLKEMDDYLLQFKDHKEVREKYLESIQEFLLDNMDYIKESEKKNKRVNNGRICITYTGKNNEVRMFSIIYQNSPKLLPIKSCIKKIKKELSNDDKLSELINRKRYLLSQYEIELITNYLMYPVSYKKYKNIFLNNFVNRIIEQSDDKLYMYVRSLMNLCNLKSSSVIETKYGVINAFEENISDKMVLRDCDDEMFVRLVDDEDYETLYNLYDIDQIEKYVRFDKIKK